MGSSLDHGWGDSGPTDPDLWKTLCQTIISQSEGEEMEEEVSAVEQSVSQMVLEDKQGNDSQESNTGLLLILCSKIIVEILIMFFLYRWKW